MEVMSTVGRPPSHISIATNLRANAKRMRRSMTDAERRLWYTLRAGRLRGLAFRRQVPIAGFIVDFACHRKRLVIEVDGATHSTDAERRRDAIRTAALEAEGYRIVRFWNDDIYRNLPGVVDRVIAATIGETEA
jgi:very-short-patch-repair endonuclease